MRVGVEDKPFEVRFRGFQQFCDGSNNWPNKVFWGDSNIAQGGYHNIHCIHCIPQAFAFAFAFEFVWADCLLPVASPKDGILCAQK
jgi:hypothetical protein